MSLETEGRFQFVHQVELLPTEKLDILVGLAVFLVGVFVLVMHFHGASERLATEVTVGSRLLEDGVGEAETLHDEVGAQVDHVLHLEGDLGIAHLDVRRAVGVDVEAHRLGHADGVGDLNQGLVADAGGHEVLGDVAGGIGCRAVHLRAVLAREGTAAVGAATTVGVDDDFAACKTRVAVGATDDELARGVHVELHVVSEELLQVFGQLFLHPRDEDVAHVGFDFGQHGFIVGKLVVLRADDDGVDAERFPAFAVFHRHLRLGVGAEVGHLLAFLADDGQFPQQEVREVDGERHVVLGLLAGEAEHHALVAGALVFRILAANALENVVRLSVKGREHATLRRMGFKENNIIVRFRKDFSEREIQKFILPPNA